MLTRTFAVLIVAAVTSLTAACATAAKQASDQLNQQIASATTRTDHERLAARYELAAETAEKEAEVHRQAKARYELSPYSGFYSTHHSAGAQAGFMKRCESAIRASEQLAADDRELARLHRELAGALKD